MNLLTEYLPRTLLIFNHSTDRIDPSLPSADENNLCVKIFLQIFSQPKLLKGVSCSLVKTTRLKQAQPTYPKQK